MGTWPPGASNTEIGPCRRLEAESLRMQASRNAWPENFVRSIYGKRKETSESVFGQIKQVRGFRQFLLRGMDKVRGGGVGSGLSLTHRAQTLQEWLENGNRLSFDDASSSSMLCNAPRMEKP